MATGHGLGLGIGLGEAHAETDSDGTESSTSDSSPGTQSATGSTTQSSVDTPAAAGPATEPTPTATASAGENASSGTSSEPDASPPEMHVASSGGLNNSTNDTGQATNIEAADAPTPTSHPIEIVEPTTPSTATPDVATSSSTDAEQSSTSTTSDSPAASAPQVDTTRVEAGDVTTKPTPVVTRMAAVEPTDVQSNDEQSPAEGEMQGFSLSSPPLESETSEPSEPEVTTSSEMVDVASMLVSVYLSPFVDPAAPVGPVQPNLVWAVLAWIRREIQYTFFNREPQVSPQDITLALAPGEVSEPIPFYGYDADGDHIRYRVPERGDCGGPSHGTVVVDQMTGTFTYQADQGYTGPDEFTVIVSDVANCFHIHGFLSFLRPNFGHTDRAVISLMSIGANATPVTADDSYTNNEDHTLTATAAAGVLANDSDAEAEPLTVADPGIFTTAHGSVNLAADGSFVYTPTPDYNGTDSFTYAATDGTTTSAPASVTITITAVNDVPVAVDDSFTVAEDTALAGHVLGNDVDVDNALLTTTLAGGATHGTVVLGLDGSFIYTPDDDFNGTDAFTYTASDGWSISAPATVTITVAAVNDPPVAVGDTVNTVEDTPVSGNVLGNDIDVDSPSLSTTLASGPTHGTVILGLGGSFIYTPDDDYNGTDSFSYTVSDGTATSTPATVTITITAVNDAPVAVDDSFTTAEDSALAGFVLGNDFDVDNASLTTILAIGPTHGTVILGLGGSFIYTPDDDYNGTDSFSYTVSDGTATSTPATVTITITAVNDAPVAVDDSFTTEEDSTVAGNVLGNDFDVDNASLTTILTNGPTHGTVILGLDGSFIYTPDDDYRGTDSFTYIASDGTAATNPAVVTITITAVNDAPIAIGDTFTTEEDSTVAGNVLGNDFDVDSASLSTTLASGATHGTVVLGADGSFIYTPDDDYNGTDSFTYTATDGMATSTPATVTITITAVNDAPIAIGDTFTTAEDVQLTANVLDNDTDVDNDSLTTTLAVGPAHGTVTLANDGSFTYTPTANYNGSDSFTYRVNDGTATSTPATVTITITAVNDVPVAVGDSYAVAENGTLIVVADMGLLDNDFDVDGGTLTTTLASVPTHGTVTVSPDGSFTYTPDANYFGGDSFSYTATDGTATSAPATVTIVVGAVNDAPVAVDDTYTVAEDGSLIVNAGAGVLGNDTDIENSTLTATLVTGPANGTLVLGSDGSFTYTPTANFNGTDSFTYTASDGVDSSAPATVTITITAVNDTPTAVNDAFTTDEDTQLTGNVLTNDSDVENSTLTATLVTGPANGTLVLNTNGSFTYTPTANFNGTDSFTYTASDGTATSSPATVTITITAVNDTPTAVNDTFTTDEDVQLTGNVLTNDTDVENTTLTATLVTGPTNGNLTLNANGSFTYTPATNFNGSDSFTYTASDGLATSTPATVTITITAVNDTPVAIDDSFTTNEDTQLTGNVLTNDSDVEGSTLTTTLVTGPTNGTLVLGSDGSFTYTPTTNFNGTDSFTYRASDGTATSSPATVTITITAVNDTPVAIDDSFTTDEDTQLTGNVLTNDTDVENTTLTTTLVAGPANGTLVLAGDGSFTYTPTTNFNGTDSFTYTASDGVDSSAAATVTITITAVNDAPTAVNDTFTTDEDVQLTGNVLTNDSDVEGSTLTTTLVTGPANGTLVLGSDGSFTYTPTANYNGTDTFTYTASDGTATSSPATVTITITAVNDTPTAVNDTFTTDEDVQLTGNVLTNDTDVENSTLTATLVTGPANGTLVLNANGSFTYTPAANFNGTDSFTYTASDGTDTSTPATVTITITAVNDAPTAVNDSFTTDEDTQLTGNVLTNDSDVEGSTLTATLVTGPANGTLVLNANGSFTYTPATNFNGTDSFTYAASDGLAASTPATVTITITAVNDTPTAVNDTFTTDEDVQLTGNVLTNDTDVENSTLTATLVTGPTNGTLVLNANGSFTYTPTANFNGTDSFTYTASDGTDTSSPATVTITITAVNDTPTAVNDSFTTDEDVQLTGNVLTNDGDVEGSTLTATVVTGPSNGTLVLNANGSFTYTPTTNFNGTDSFTYTASDGTDTSTPATVTITITAVNDTPTAIDDSFTTNEDTQLTDNVLGNDTDVENSTLTTTLVTGPTNGSLVLAADGSFTYTPNANFNGTDSFTYTASDGTDTSSPATVTITITAVNDTPTAVNDAVTTDEDTQLTGNVLTNDTDVEGSTLTATLVAGPTNGTLVLNANGSFTYTPTTNFNGTDSFTYTASDATDTSTPATVTITITAVNDTPVAIDDSFITNEDTQLTDNVLGNDTDVENSTLTATLITGPTNGTLVLASDGSFTYTPTANFNGTDSFTYTASDGTATSTPATVTITITAVNDAPTAVNDSFTTDEDVQLTGNVLTNDSDVEGSTLTATLVAGPTNGTLVLNANGSFTYTPATNFNGTDSFTYTASDGLAASTPATVTITITAVNDAPTAVNDTFTTDEDTQLTGNVVTNDTDVEGSNLTATLVAGPTNGTLTLNANGSFTYTPTANFNGTDSFTYTASDGTDTSTPATVTITITAVNDTPVAIDDSFTTDEDVQLTGNVLTNDTDVENTTLTATLVTGPTNGNLTLNANGSFTYTPTTNFNGTDSFTYTASDGTATSSPATVTITITAVNDTPTATNDTFTTSEDTQLAGNVLTNDTDVEGSTLTATLVTGPTNGTLVLNANGSFTYTPTTNFNGSDSFTYTASDGLATSTPATVTITITAVNDAPTAVNDSFTTDEDVQLTGNVLTNDTDVENSTLTTTLVTGPTNGSLVLAADGSFTYTPNANFNGTDSFTYTASDGTDTSSPATVTITITAVNDTPTATNDTFTTSEDTQLTGNVLTNDTDVEGSTLTATLVTGPTNGTLVLNANGSFTYTPATNFNGSDSFTYTASDGTATSSPATVTITITAVNDTPTAVNDSFTTDEDVQLTGNVLTNDTDVEGSTLTTTLVDGPTNGTLVLGSDGSFTYTPTANFNGTDSFTYTASDGTDTSSPATVTITITAVNDTPTATNDTFTTSEDTQLTGNVLTNDTDVEGSTLTATLVAGPTNGTLVLNANGSFTYTPTTNFNGSDSFTYTASDGTATSSPATVTITITAVNDTPTAVNDSFTTDEDVQLTGNVLTNDTDVEGSTLTTTLVDGPTNGTLVLGSDGSFTYTPTANFNGSDSFTYTASDGTDTSSPATVTITITAVNDTPTATNDTFTTSEDTQLTDNVVTNDTDVEGSTLTATLVAGPTNGTLVLNANGSFTYTPATNFNGTDSFTYTASDGTATSSPATVTITITAVNDTPTAVNDTFTTSEDTQLTGNVLTNDTDVEGSTLTATLVTGPTNGTLVLNANGSFTYTPTTNFNGSDSFTYTASDGLATSTPATVTITITAVNDAPTAVNDSFTTNEDTQLTGNVLTNDTDVEGSTLTATLVTGPTNGTLVLNANGSFTYTPATNFNGTDSFTYTASDGTATSSPATVTITITAVNDTPTAVNDTFTTDEDVQLTGNVLTNDGDVENSTLTATLVTGPTNGTLVLSANGSFTYTPTTNFNGTDSFTYTASDGAATSTPATVTITITAVNDTPTAVNDTFTTDEDVQLTGNVLTNDTDVEGSTLTTTLVTGPTNGTLVLAADGSFTYTPTANFNGTDSFTYTASDGTATSSPATVTITITAVNDTPTAVNDSFTTDEDVQLTGNVLTNDGDVEGSTLTATVVTGPTNGTLVLASDGSFTYKPTANFNGTDSFTYTASDGTATSTPATVTITITAVNDTPVAIDDSFTTDEDVQLTGNVLTNDSDVEGSTLTAAVVTGPSNGTLVLGSDGSFTYTPTANFNGTDSFTYTATDGTATSSPATVTITITAVNDTPTAVNDTFTTDEDVQLTGNVLTNDGDVENSTLTATLVTGPANGTLVLNTNGSFTYTPTANFNGTDSFTYTASDATATSSPATVTITITAVNDTPTAVNDSFTTDEDVQLTGNVLTNDGDVEGSTLTATLVAGPTNGTLVLNANGSFTYTPATNFNGTDSFTYTASDGTATSSPATVAITITAVNDTPTATNDTFTTNEDTQLTGNVLTNDTDVEGTTLSATLVTGPANGTLVLNANGSFTYTPTTNFNGTDSFTYTASDGTATSSPATVTITITAVNDTPTAVNDAFTTDEDVQLTGNVVTNDTDVEGSTLTATLVAGPTNGTLVLASDGSFTYTPTTNFNGTDSFTYTASDGLATSTPATVTITITAVNDTPTAVNDTFTTDEDTQLTGNVLTNDTDVENSTLTATLVTGPTNGSLVLAADGSFTYTPNANFNGTDSFTYTASDGTDSSTPATVTITITAVNDAPTAVNDTFTTNEDTQLTGNVLTNDTDVEGTTLTATLVTGPTNGTLTLNANGSFTYTPTANYNGADTFTYRASDGQTTSNLATVTITITAVNDTPVAVNDAYTVAEDGSLTQTAGTGVLANDTDVENTTLTATLVTGPTHGALTLNASGSFTYTPTANYNGTDTFTYTATDGQATSTAATVTITITAVNDAPIATNDTFTTNEDVQLAGNVLTNDTDIDSGTLTAAVVTGPSHGALILNTDGTFTYTPTANYNGADTFTYRASDGQTTSNLATVSITITAVNDTPVAVNDAYTVAEDGSLTQTAGTGVLANDTDVENTTLTATLVTGPTHGALTLNANGSFTYTPTANYNGTDTFTYTATDGQATSTAATVTITITAVNDAPIATNDTFTTNEDVQLAGNVLTNDTDIDSGTLTAAVVTGPSHGALILNTDGTFTYTPTANYNGADTFTYRASDGQTTSNLATVSITITAVNDTPVAVNDAYTVAEDGSLTQTAGTGVLANDTDVENTTLTATLVTGPTHGALTLNANGSFTYTPTTNFNGTDTFTYTATDGQATSTAATVTITITAVNDAPIATNDTFTTNQDTQLTGNVLTNDTDIDSGTTLTVASPGTITTAHGNVVLASNGSFTYTPTAGYNGADSFTYRASDGVANSNLATVSITVVDNVAPTAVGVQTTNGGSTIGRAEQNDTIVYTFSEPIDPGSILAGWNGSATSVVVRIYDGDILLGALGNNDTLQIYNATNTTAVGLGTVSLGGDNYATSLLGGLLGSNIRFGATGTASTMTMTGNTVTIVFGTFSSSNSLLVGRGTETTDGSMVWIPVTGLQDLAANPLTSTTPVTESGPADTEF